MDVLTYFYRYLALFFLFSTYCLLRSHIVYFKLGVWRGGDVAFHKFLAQSVFEAAGPSGMRPVSLSLEREGAGECGKVGADLGFDFFFEGQAFGLESKADEGWEWFF